MSVSSSNLKNIHRIYENYLEFEIHKNVYISILDLIV